MRFYNRQHRHYCGIDLHVKTMYVCILDATGQTLVHRNVPSTPEAFLAVVAPYRDNLDFGPQDRASGVLHVVARHRVFDEAVPRGVAGRGRVSQTSNSSHGTELAQIAQHACAAKRHEPPIMSHRSGSERV